MHDGRDALDGIEIRAVICRQSWPCVSFDRPDSGFRLQPLLKEKARTIGAGLRIVKPNRLTSSRGP